MLDGYRSSLAEYYAYALHELRLGNALTGDAGVSTREADEAVRQFVCSHVNESAGSDKATDGCAPMQHRPPDASTSLLLVNTAYFRGEHSSSFANYVISSP